MNKLKNPISVKQCSISIEVSKAINENLQRINIEGYASTTAVDRSGDYFDVGFWNANCMKNFLANPMMLYNHNRSEPIGQWESHEVTEKGLLVKGWVSKSWKDAWRVEEGIVKALSVYARVSKIKYLSDLDVWAMLDGELIEISVCPLPDNPETIFDLAKGLDETQKTELNNIKKELENQNNLPKMEKLKDLFAAFKAKFLVDIPTDATIEQAIEVVNAAKSFDDMKAEITADVKKELAATSNGDEKFKAMQKSIDDLKIASDAKTKELEGEIVKLKSVETGDNRGGQNPPAPIGEFYKALSAETADKAQF